VHGSVCGSIHAVPAPAINGASAFFESSPSPVQGVLGVGAQVTLTIDITDASGEPTCTVTVFGGDPIAASGSGPSYTFSYTIQAGDQGPIVFNVSAENFAGGSLLDVTYPDVTAGGCMMHPRTALFMYDYDIQFIEMCAICRHDASECDCGSILRSLRHVLAASSSGAGDLHGVGERAPA